MLGGTCLPLALVCQSWSCDGWRDYWRCEAAVAVVATKVVVVVVVVVVAWMET